jgi:hypothetical protein
MYNDYIVLRLGQERARELYMAAEEAGLTQRRWRERRLAKPARIAWASAVMTIVALVVGAAILSAVL